ncbi:MAG TPA: LysM peptidoglycan-binding domain-containing protein, partial [Candidatus Paceibacterota bacterium]|nr:LysM peptidoglycan-binding domain-containing protein [Candidatus Paceibacterota bacterium]
SLLEQNKRRSRMKLGVFCVLAVGVCGLTAMLIQGCKRENPEAEITPPSDTNVVSTTDTNLLPAQTSNSMAYVPPLPTSSVPIVVPPPVPEPTTTEYTVVAGDTLGKIAKKSGVTLKALEDANRGVVPTKLKVGQKLVIPAPAGGMTVTGTTGTTTSAETGEESYKVKSGDTLTKIAKANGTTVKRIMSENDLTTTRITVGQKLKIPAKAEAAIPPAMPAAPVAPADMPPTPAPTN